MNDHNRLLYCFGSSTSKTMLVATNPAQGFEDRDQQLADHFGIITVSMLPEWNIRTINRKHWVRWQQQVLWLAPKTGMDLEQEQEPVSDHLR